MFVQPSRLVTQGAFVVGLATLSSACDAPTLSTDLRPDGAPEVLSVLVMNDADNEILELATFCKANDDKRPGLLGTPIGPVQICGEDLSTPAEPITDAVPTVWHVRIMFDELLDPGVEDLIPILDQDTQMETGQFEGTLAATQPVTLTCGGTAVAYDGYYNPSGNNVTFPLGPSLFIQPTNPEDVASGSECTVAIKDLVVDKDNNKVPDDQRANSAYTFSIDSLKFAGSSPAAAKDPAKASTINPKAPVVLRFNGFIDAATLSAAEVSITELVGPDCAVTAGGVAATPVIAADPKNDLAINLSVTDGGAGLAFKPLKAYVVTFAAGNAVADVAGGPGALPVAAAFNLCFKTSAAAP